jgi:hypothetical protein
VSGQEIAGTYLPGHLLGDRGWLCVRNQELKVLGCFGDAAGNHLKLKMAGSSQTARGVRLRLSDDITTEISESDFAALGASDCVRVQFSPASVHFLSK